MRDTLLCRNRERDFDLTFLILCLSPALIRDAREQQKEVTRPGPVLAAT